jgi:hypothetical protein
MMSNILIALVHDSGCTAKLREPQNTALQDLAGPVTLNVAKHNSLHAVVVTASTPPALTGLSRGLTRGMVVAHAGV